MISALDSNILIDYQKSLASTPDPALAEMFYRVHALLEILEESGDKIVVPSVVVCEILCPIPIASHPNFIAKLEKTFFVYPFDIRASSLAADLFQQHRQLPADQQIARKELKLDVLIVATAKVAGADRYYSHDAKCRKLADSAGMAGLDLPTSYPDLFRDAELKRRFGLS